MAQLGIQGTWKSIFALASMLTLYGLMAYASFAHVSLGVMIYLIALLVLVLGFWSKEDSVAVGGIIGISMLVILDILLRIGVLGFNGVQVIGH